MAPLLVLMAISLQPTSFANTKIAEDVVQNIFRGGLTGNFAKVIHRQANVYGQNFVAGPLV